MALSAVCGVIGMRSIFSFHEPEQQEKLEVCLRNHCETLCNNLTKSHSNQPRQGLLLLPCHAEAEEDCVKFIH